VIGIYLTVQLLLILAWAAARGLRRLPLSPAHALKLGRLAFALALAAPLAVSFAPAAPDWRPAPQVWSAPAADGGSRLSLIGGEASPSIVVADRALDAAVDLGAAGLGLACLWAVLAAVVLRRRLSGTARWRRIGRVEIRVGAGVESPFAAWMPGRALVVLDRATFAHPVDRAIAIRHELQHHRQGDTRFAWGLLSVRAACAWNPFVHLLARELAALEELACDAGVIARGRVSRRDYGACLLRAASALRAPSPLAMRLIHPSLLKRRIEMLTLPRRARRALTLPIAALLGLASIGAAWAADGLVLSVTVDPDEVYAAAREVNQRGDLQVPSHPVVVAGLQDMVVSQRGRSYLHEGLRNSKEYQDGVSAALEAYGLPQELAAVPLIESGYKNLGDGVEGLSFAPGIPGKGLWMFIPATARDYDLTVDDVVDERLDIALETDAAMRLLSDLHDEFGDWGLALAGYNQGARKVRAAIAAEGTDDPWTLIARGALNDYAAKVMAGVLVMEDAGLIGPDLGRTIDLDLKDADINSVLRMLAEAGQVDVVLDEPIEGTVTMELKGVPVGAALDSVLESADVTVESEGDRLIVSP